MVGEHLRDVAEQMAAVKGLGLYLDEEVALVARPRHFHDAVGLRRLKVKDVDAVGAMHRHALHARNETDDLVAGHRHAAAGELDPHAFDALDGDPHVALVGVTRRGGQHGVLDLLDRLFGAGVLDHVGDNVLRGDGALADVGQHRVGVGESQFLGNARHGGGRHEDVHRHVALAHRVREVVAPGVDHFGAAFLREPLADLVARLGALDEAEPVMRRSGVLRLRREHLDGVAVLQFRVERHEPAVDARAHRVVAHLGVHGVGEVDRRGVRRQRDDLALGREHIHLRGAKVLLESAEELIRVRRLARPVRQLLDPLEVVRLAELLAGRGVRGLQFLLALAVRVVRLAQRTPGLAVLLVLPMRGDAEFAAAVHLPRADLDFDGLAARPHDGRVQRLVHVELGHGDVILETPRHRAPARMHGAKRGIAVTDRIDDDAHAQQVVDVLELDAAHDHLLVDAVIVLRPAGDVGVDALRLEVLFDLVDDLLEIDLALAGAMLDEQHDLVVDLRLECLEAQFLQLGLDGVHAQAVGQGRIHVEGLAGLALGARGLDVAPCAGVVHAVGELDHEDAHVSAHGDDHLADRLGLRGLPHVHLRELGDAVHEPRDGVAEFLAALVERVIGVLHRVVEQSGGDDGGAHAQVGERLRDGEGVDDVGFAGFAPLRAVLLDGAHIGPAQYGKVDVGMVLAAHLPDGKQRVCGVGADLAAEFARSDARARVARRSLTRRSLALCPRVHGRLAHRGGILRRARGLRVLLLVHVDVPSGNRNAAAGHPPRRFTPS